MPPSTTTTTLPPPLCDTGPATGCRLAEAGRAQLQIKDKEGDTKDQIRWKWNKGEATTVEDFADPVNGSAEYRFCIYDESATQQPLLDAELVAGGACGRRACWTPTGKRGFKFGNREGTPAGITAAKLKAGDDGRAQVQIRAAGDYLLAPAPPLALPVTAQLVIDDGATTRCWQTEFPSAKDNEPEKFKARVP